MKSSFYSNRSYWFLKLENFSLAIKDATSAIELDKNNIKAYYRRGVSYFAIHKMKKAFDDFKSALYI